MKINEVLAKSFLKNNLISQKMLGDILEEIRDKNTRLSQELLDRHLVTDEAVALVNSEFFEIPYEKIGKIPKNPEIMHLVSQRFVEKNLIIPLNITDGVLVIAVGNPFDHEAMQKISSFVNGPYRIVIAPQKEIFNLKNIVFSKTVTAEAISSFVLNGISNSKIVATQKSELYGADVESAPAVRLTDSLVREAIAHGASDIHIEPFESSIRVRYRVDGELYDASSFDNELYPSVLTRIKIVSGINIAKKRIPQDGRITQRINDNDYDFRVSTLPTAFGERVVIRILDTKAFDFNRSQLGFLDVENKMINHMLKQPHGIILLVGPTGCGKTTTLYSFIKELNHSNRNIVTVEDPIEYTIEGIGQVQVNPQADLTFARALRSILRQDPNTIMIGEIRDEETAQIAIRSAITGHLVLSTLHTNDAPGSVTRLLDMGIEPFFVADAIVGIIAQRLIRKLCPECRKKRKSTPNETLFLKLDSPEQIYEAKGCPACNYTGYNGRYGIHEILIVNDDIKELIQRRASTLDIQKKAIENGMLTLFDTCKTAVLNGISSFEELVKIVYMNQTT